MFVSYVVKVQAAGEQGEGGFTAKGSVILRDGEALAAATVGEKRLIICARVIGDEVDAAQAKPTKTTAGKQR